MKLRKALGRIRGRLPQSETPPAGGREELVPTAGYERNLTRVEFVEPLSDEDLAELNRLLDWKCFVADSRGRRFGNAAWAGKRCEPQAVPDRRIVALNERFDLSDKHVLEVGCFEGVHTAGLSMFAKGVTAVDSRIENVVKTIVRCALFGFHPEVFKCDIEARPLDHAALAADVMHHVGVLYHLKDPVGHLLDLKNFIRRGVMLDTHYAKDEEAAEAYEIGGKEYRYRKYQEYGHADPFSGMYDHSKWLRLDDIVALLGDSGFGSVEIVETRDERNGPRVLLMAGKS